MIDRTSDTPLAGHSETAVISYTLSLTLPRCLAAVQASFIFNPTGTMSPDSDRIRKGGARDREKEEEI